MSLSVGDKAPLFTLRSQENTEVSLQAQLGGAAVLLLFFPFANTGTCTAEMCTMRDNFARYTALNAKVFGVSVDSPFALKMWHEMHGINFPLLSDFNKEVSAAYGSLYDVFVPGVYNYRGVSKRAAFVIDAGGIIRYAEVLDDARLEPNYAALQSTLQALQNNV